MLVKIIGFFWVILGILFLIKPQLLRKRLQTKGIKKLKKNLFLLTLFLSITLIMASFKADGLTSKAIMVLGIVGILKGFFFLKAKGAEKLISWFSQKPLALFRLGGATYLIIGIIMLKFL